MTKKKFFCVCFCLAMLSACSQQPTKSVAVIPVEERYVPTATDSIVPVPASEPVQPTVIASLIEQTNVHAAAGDTDRAIASLERALRIEPANAMLWHRFALIRLQQNDWQQAIALARKSNALAPDNTRLKSQNWAIIARAYEELGELEKAREARRQQRLTG